MGSKKDQATWVGYIPELKVHDCTIRDGGLMNDHRFEDNFVKAVWDACIEAGIDYTELGYKADKKIFAPTDFGPWKFCDEDDLRRIAGDDPKDIKITVMADAERTDYHTDILPGDQSVIDTIRVATYIHQIPTAIDMIKDANEKGYDACCNIMAISAVHDKDLRQALDQLAKTPVKAVYIVDSFGSLYPEEVRDLTKLYKKALSGTGIEVGIHAHNNQQLAYANTIEALISGATRLDATINGLGRGAGNCSLELLIGFLHNPKFKLRPVLDCIQNYFEPLKEKVEWGFTIPYMITGQFNQHPRSAIKMRAGDDPDNYVGFYDQTLDSL